jgi:hypothetical protein
MSQPLEVTYDVAEVEGLTEASKVLNRLSLEVVGCLPAWEKIYHASKYIQQRQKEVLADALADPEAA